MRKFMAFIELDEDTALRYSETNGVHPDMTPGEYLEMEFGWLEQSGLTLSGWRILDDDSDLFMERYAEYLAHWAYEHASDEEVSSPMTPDEFRKCEKSDVTTWEKKKFRVVNKETQKDITSDEYWVIRPDGNLYYLDYGDLIGYPDAVYIEEKYINVH